MCIGVLNGECLHKNNELCVCVSLILYRYVVCSARLKLSIELEQHKVVGYEYEELQETSSGHSQCQAAIAIECLAYWPLVLPQVN